MYLYRADKNYLKETLYTDSDLQQIITYPHLISKKAIIIKNS